MLMTKQEQLKLLSSSYRIFQISACKTGHTRNENQVVPSKAWNHSTQNVIKT